MAREENYALLGDILGELCELFPSEYIHVGGDEVDMTQWKRCPDCQALMRQRGMADPHQLEDLFMQRMAAILGINTDRVISLVFVIGAAMAGLAGVLVTMNYGTFDFYIGFIIGIKAFTAAVFGGIGSIPGAVVGAFLIGICESVIKGSDWSVFSDAFTFALLIVVLCVKPTGLFGEKVTDKV